MSPLHVGDQVTFRTRSCVVRGFTPMGVSPTLVHLEDARTGERLVAPAADISIVSPDEPRDPASSITQTS